MRPVLWDWMEGGGAEDFFGDEEKENVRAPTSGLVGTWQRS